MSDPSTMRWNIGINGPEDESFTVEVVTTEGKASSVLFRVFHEYVEVRHHEMLAGFLRRTRLRDWLSNLVPGSEFRGGRVTLRAEAGEGQALRVLLSLPDVDNWALSPRDHVALRGRVGVS